jgi:plastocyanin
MAKAKKVKRTRRHRSAIVWGGGVLVAALLVSAAWFGFGGGGKSPARAPVRQAPVVSREKLANVDVVDKDYNPRTLTVSKGATVVWKFRGDLPHNVTDDRGAFSSDTQTDGEYSHTFATAGTFYYYRSLHHGMQGTLIVTE